MKTRSHLRNLYNLALIASIGPSPLFAQSPGKPDRSITPVIEQLKTFIRDGMNKTGVPGVAVAVVYRDRVVYLDGFGYRKAGSNDKVDPDTVFQLASLSYFWDC
jgi:CubicO group peptidase (beta-lactamase class C family)